MGLMFVGCAGPEIKKFGMKPIKARITVYSAHEDHFGSKVAMCSKMRAKQGETVAAHPDFKFGTKLIIPELGKLLGDSIYEIQDRGSSITKKIASFGKSYVFDVFIAGSNRNMRRITKNWPPYMDVFVSDK